MLLLLLLPLARLLLLLLLLPSTPLVALRLLLLVSSLIALRSVAGCGALCSCPGETLIERWKSHEADSDGW